MPENLTPVQEGFVPKEPLGDEAMGNLLAAFGNNEAKALALISFKPGVIYTRGNMRRKIIEAQGDQIEWEITAETLFDYCSDSLSPIGLVTREMADPEKGIWGYEITDYGKDVGVPLAGYLLDFSLNYRVSLSQLLGPTNTNSDNKSRSPLNRVNIFWELLTRSLPLRQTDLSDNPDIDKSITKHHLQYLGEERVVTYRAIESDKPFSIYRLNAERPTEQPVGYRENKTHVPTLTQEIYSIFVENPDRDFTFEDMITQLIEAYPLKAKQTKLRHLTEKIMAYLKKQGYLVQGEYNAKNQSQIDLDDEQRRLLEDFIDIIHSFQSGDLEFLEKGQKLAQDILADPEKVTLLMKKARNSSSRFNRIGRSELVSLVYSIISQHPGITNQALREKLKQRGIRLVTHTVDGLTHQMEREELIESIKEKTIKNFFPRAEHVGLEPNDPVIETEII